METKQEKEQIIVALRQEIREAEFAVNKYRADIARYQGQHGYAKHVEYLEDKITQGERRIVNAADELMQRTGVSVRKPGRPPKNPSNVG